MSTQTEKPSAITAYQIADESRHESAPKARVIPAQAIGLGLGMPDKKWRTKGPIYLRFDAFNE